MARTRRELIDQVLDNLGVLVPGQAPGDEAVSRVDRVIDPTFAMLVGQGVPSYVGDPGLPNPPSGGEIDDAMFLPLASCVAWSVAGGFNLADSPALKTLQIEAIATLRVIGRPASTRRTLSTDFQLRGNKTRAAIGNFSRGT